MVMLEKLVILVFLADPAKTEPPELPASLVNLAKMALLVRWDPLVLLVLMVFLARLVLMDYLVKLVSPGNLGKRALLDREVMMDKMVFLDLLGLLAEFCHHLGINQQVPPARKESAVLPDRLDTPANQASLEKMELMDLPVVLVSLENPESTGLVVMRETSLVSLLLVIARAHLFQNAQLVQ